MTLHSDVYTNRKNIGLVHHNEDANVVITMCKVVNLIVVSKSQKYSYYELMYLKLHQ